MPVAEAAVVVAPRNDGRASNRATGHDIVSWAAREGRKEREGEGGAGRKGRRKGLKVEGLGEVGMEGTNGMGGSSEAIPLSTGTNTFSGTVYSFLPQLFTILLTESPPCQLCLTPTTTTSTNHNLSPQDTDTDWSRHPSNHQLNSLQHDSFPQAAHPTQALYNSLTIQFFNQHTRTGPAVTLHPKPASVAAVIP
ncbi:hypothetical protein E2C01_080536 [Portunus trituberculatus]|uniref:Uncharacterized protein n=1 Tax=Portunus trituberculatus TaxID=210409 RepID=A0A5B7IVN5_PORTR|nr:hypothetical protein [Portunus trituberculatus]